MRHGTNHHPIPACPGSKFETQPSRIRHTRASKNNPLCLHCNARTWRRGYNGDKQVYQCCQCRRYFQLSYKVDNNPPCPKCKGNSKRDGLSKNGKQIYLCNQCSCHFRLSYQDTNNPPCPGCNGKSRRRGISCGKHVYTCTQCQRWFRCTPQQQRQHEIRQQAEQLPALIEQKLPKSLPVEIREELQQELVVAALAGEFELSELDQVIISYRRKVYRESLTGFAYVSLDAVIPHTEGLTYADTLAG